MACLTSMRPRSRRTAIAVLTLILSTGAAAWAGQGVEVLDANQAFPDSRTALLAAAAVSGDAGRVTALVRSGANVNAHGDKNVTLLQWALLNESTAGMEALLSAGADPTLPGMDNDTVVHLAAMANDPKYLELLLKHGADPNAHNGVTRATPLVSALMGKREKQFRDLLAAGADPNAADRTGNTPLHQAAKINEPQRVLDLLEAGANPNAVNTTGATFQHFLFRAPDQAVTPDVRRGREAVRDWLRRHDVPIEDVSAH
jgi:uncharacterized protein